MPPQPTRHHMNAHECGRSPFAITQRPGRRSQPRPQRICGYPLATRDHRRVDRERIVRRSDALSQHRITPPQPRAACGSEATATADIEMLGRPVGESCRTSRCNAHSCSAPGVAAVPSRTSRSNTPSLLSRVQRLEREAAKSAELGQASVRARDTRHPLGGNAPVQKGCNAYGSGVAPRETRTNAEAARTSDTSTSASTPPWRVVLRRRQACGHQLPLVRRAWSWRTASQPKSPELHWYGVATDRYSEACEPCR